MVVVNVSLSPVSPVRVRSVPDWPDTVTVTSSEGCVFSLTVYVSPVVSPSSTVKETGSNTMPRSSSMTVTAMSGAVTSS